MTYSKDIKMFPIYKIFSYDLLFYYAISMLYLTIVKNISTSDVLLMGAIYSIVSMIVQIPASVIVDKIGLKKSMIAGNILLTFWGILIIVAPNFGILIIGDVLVAIGFALKNVAEFPYVCTVMKRENMKDEISRVEGKGSALYFVVEAIGSVIAGFLFEINPYLPIIFCTLSCLTATLISFSFSNISIKKDCESSQNLLEELRHGLKFIFNSSRLKAMLLYAGVFYGVVVVAANLSRVYLTDLKLSPAYFGLVFAAMSIISALGSRLQRRIEKITRNKTLKYVAYIFLSTFIFLGVSYLFEIPRQHLLILGIIMFGIQHFLKGGYRIVIKNYLNYFTSSAIRPKIMSIYFLIEHLGAGIALLIASEVLKLTNVGLAFILFGTIFFIAMIICISFMKSRLGKKMEEYDETEIRYTP